MTLSRALLLAALLPLLAFSTVFAEDVSVDAAASTEASADMQNPGTRPLPIKPIDALRRAKEAQRDIRANAQDARQEWRAETRMELQGAAPGEKRDVVREAMPERMQIAKDRIASTTKLRLKMKDAVQKHAGLVRERFSNAIAHLEKFMARIESRVEKLSSQGVDVSAVVALQSDAESAIAQARTDISAVREYTATVTDESDREAVKSEISSLVQTAQESIKAAHAAVKAVVTALVDLSKANQPPSGEVEAEASVSAESSQ